MSMLCFELCQLVKHRVPPIIQCLDLMPEQFRSRVGEEAGGPGKPDLIKPIDPVLTQFAPAAPTALGIDPGGQGPVVGPTRRHIAVAKALFIGQQFFELPIPVGRFVIPIELHLFQALLALLPKPPLTLQAPQVLNPNAQARIASTSARNVEMPVDTFEFEQGLEVLFPSDLILSLPRFSLASRLKSKAQFLQPSYAIWAQGACLVVCLLLRQPPAKTVRSLIVGNQTMPVIALEDGQIPEHKFPAPRGDLYRFGFPVTTSSHGGTLEQSSRRDKSLEIRFGDPG
jgi:hypothetical protein